MKAEVTTIRLRPEVKAAVRKAAADDSRSLSDFIGLALAKVLRERGYLKPERDK